MGKFNQGIHGSFRGKVGKVADSSWIKMCHTYPWLRKKKCGTFYRGLNITGEYPDYSINYSKVWVSCGILNVATEAKATEAAGQVTFTWTDTRNEDSFGKPDDKAILVIYCEAQNKCIFRLRGLEGFIRDSYNHKDLKPSRFFQ